MIFILNFIAVQLRKIATKLDGQDVVQYITVHESSHYEITVFTTSGADPEYIGKQINFHLGLRHD